MDSSSLINIKKAIDQACSSAGRSKQSVKLLAVSKWHSTKAIAALHAQGQEAFGESYVSESLEKISALPNSIVWHFIGPIQSNKCQAIAKNFDWVQSVDRDKILQRLDRFREGMSKLPICLQINISGEASKQGCTSEALWELAELTDQLPNLELRGIMAIPQKTDDEALKEEQFRSMQSLFEQLKKRYTSVDTLSLGMSADFEAAIAYGSTCVRVGTALFGHREAK